MTVFLDQVGGAAAMRFFERCARHVDLDINQCATVAAAVLNRHRGASFAASMTAPHDALMSRWYASLGRGAPDFSVYNDHIYAAELWMCWEVYSRKYLRSLSAPNSMAGTTITQALSWVRSVVDFGCGAGYTTAALREMFPSARVMATNIGGTFQYAVAGEIGREVGFDVSERFSVPRVDLAFASEFFEHFASPIEALRDHLDMYQPTAILAANAFTAQAIGHFPSYCVDGKYLNGDATSRAFGAEMRARGYSKQPTRLWNNRPSLWVRDGSATP